MMVKKSVMTKKPDDLHHGGKKNSTFPLALKCHNPETIYSAEGKIIIVKLNPYHEFGACNT